MNIHLCGEVFASGRVRKRPRRKLCLEGEICMPQLLFASATMALMITCVAYQVHKVRRLRSHGRRIVAVVTAIRHESGKTTWGVARDNYAVTGTWTSPRTGRTYTFWTWAMRSRPACTPGSLVPVVIDPDNPKRYALEL